MKYQSLPVRNENEFPAKIKQDIKMGHCLFRAQSWQLSERGAPGVTDMHGRPRHTKDPQSQAAKSGPRSGLAMVILMRTPGGF